MPEETSYRLTRSFDLLFESARALLVNRQKLFSQVLQQFVSRRCIHVHEPLLVLGREGDLVIGPLAGQVDAEASHDRWRMPENNDNNL